MPDGQYVVTVKGGQADASSAHPYEPAVTQWFGGFDGFVYLGIFFVALIIGWATAIGPRWRVWAQGKQGEADLQQAHKEQQIQVSRAQGRVDAANLNKQAAIIEAEAVSAQIQSIGSQLTEHDLYLKWQWIKMMEEKPEGSVIYVPTEAGLPILEAGKRKGIIETKEDNE